MQDCTTICIYCLLPSFNFHCTLQKVKCGENLQNNLYLGSWVAFSIETLYTVPKSCYSPGFQNHEKTGDYLHNLVKFCSLLGKRCRQLEKWTTAPLRAAVQPIPASAAMEFCCKSQWQCGRLFTWLCFLYSCFSILSGALRHLHIMKAAISPSRPLPDLLQASARAARRQHRTTCPPGTGTLSSPQ